MQVAAVTARSTVAPPQFLLDLTTHVSLEAVSHPSRSREKKPPTHPNKQTGNPLLEFREDPNELLGKPLHFEILLKEGRLKDMRKAQGLKIR
jgi:hypothetical protein